jgi:hypothetical protein
MIFCDLFDTDEELLGGRKSKPYMRSSKMNFTPVLKDNNPHWRDANISLDYDEHVYTVVGVNLAKIRSVTAFTSSLFAKFDETKAIETMQANPKSKSKAAVSYAGMSKEEIKRKWNEDGKIASDLGTKLHCDIECFVNDNTLTKGYSHRDLWKAHEVFMCEQSKNLFDDECREWNYFIRFLQDYPNLVPYRSEWLVYHEEFCLAGCIDMVYEIKREGRPSQFIICDWKRCKQLVMTNPVKRTALPDNMKFIQDTNFWRYCVQLSTYKIILEDKYDMQIKSMYVVRLHPSANSYEFIKMKDLSWCLRPNLKIKPK